MVDLVGLHKHLDKRNRVVQNHLPLQKYNRNLLFDNNIAKDHGKNSGVLGKICNNIVRNKRLQNWGFCRKAPKQTLRGYLAYLSVTLWLIPFTRTM